MTTTMTFPKATTATVDVHTAAEALLAVNKKWLSVTDVANYGFALGLSLPELFQAVADGMRDKA